jgi:hypothetical protein
MIRIKHLGVAPDYIITTEPVKKQLVELIQKTVIDFYGPNVQASKDYSRIINERHFE